MEQNMKKLNLLIINLILVLALTSCDFNAPLRNEMIDYYSENKNYVTLSGEITESNDNLVEIKCEELINYINYAKETCYYLIYSKQTIELSVGDQIEFVTVPFHFYNGHTLPIVELKKDGETLLSCEEGKENLINWVKTTFK